MIVNPAVRRPTPPPPRPQPPRPAAPPVQTAPVAKTQMQARSLATDSVRIGAPSAPSRNEGDGGRALITGILAWKAQGDASTRPSDTASLASTESQAKTSDTVATPSSDASGGRDAQAPKVESSPTGSPSSDASGGRDAQAPGVLRNEVGLVTGVRYPDGTQQRFGYDDSHQLNQVVSRDGTTWNRAQGSDTWSSDRGQTWQGTTRVEADGTYSHVNSQGDRTVISPDGRTTESPGFQRVVESSFAGWDADGNGFLSPQEIEKALRGDGLSADQAAALRSMRDSGGGIQAVSDDEWGFENDGITQKDVQGLQGMLRNEVTGRFAHDRTMSPEQQKATDEHRVARESLESTNAEMAKLLMQAGVDTAGVFDPTPVSDAVGAAMSLSDGDLIGAGLSLVSMLPLAGDALGKTAKGARLLQQVEKLRERVMESSARLKKAAERLEALKFRKADAAADAGSVGRTAEGAGDAAKTGRTADTTEALTPAPRLSNDVLAGLERLPRSRNPELKFGNIDTKHGPRSVEEAAKTAERLKQGESVTWFADERAIRKTLEAAPDALRDVLARDPEKLKQFLEFLNPPKEAKAFGFRFKVPGEASLGEGVAWGGQRLFNDGTAYVRYQWARGQNGVLVLRPFHAYPVKIGQ